MKKVLDTAEISVMAAVIAVCAWITLPMSVPFTLQTFGVFLALLTLGGVKGTAATAVYILTGAVGVPVFSGFKGGAAVLAGPTGGYIIGFLLIGIIYIIAQKISRSALSSLLSLALGLTVCYAFGTFFFYRYSLSAGTGMSVMSILSVCVFPFIIPDALKLALAFAVSLRLKKILPSGRKQGAEQ